MKKVASLSEVIDESQLKELNECEDTIKTFNKEFNLIFYFEKIFNENVWTRVFASLLSSEEKHGLNIQVFNFWISQISNEKTDINSLFRDKLKVKPHKIFVKTEWSTPDNRRVDLILELNDIYGNVIGIIGLENKVDSAEQEEQLADYQKAISIVFPDVPKILLYCSPNGRLSKTAEENFENCPYLPISYKSFQLVFDHFAKSTDGELNLIFKSLNNYLKLLLARVRRHEILSAAYDTTIPFNERNKYSPVLPFFNDLYEYFKKNKKFPFQGWFKTFSTNEVDIFVQDLKTPLLQPCYMLHFLNKEPRVGDYYLVRLMIHSKRIHKLNVKDKEPILYDILGQMIIPNTRGEPEHWDPWVNIWTSNKQQLEDMGQIDMKNILDLMHQAIDETYANLEVKFKEYIKIRKNIAYKDKM